ncbi:metallophosphoesterase [Simplicispira hankyongi]|uniref:Calcineurin-like phosphoesterase domain-containing protein n=1 Tax=Simplicispira hankyongi TaxID=2315688 RepID=A0A398C8I8_9BURK|nr:metallophosphoesterase [Simplicispira hankyongi]RID97158.1 hypothetical protein D3F03_15740 [Simplicispira hankyongi]
MTYDDALELFKRLLATERARPQVHGTMLALANPALIGRISLSLQEALDGGERVWMTSDLHVGHGNIIDYCNRPFAEVTGMNRHLQAQLAKVQPREWLVIVGDLAMGDHDEAMAWIRSIPGRKVLVLGNHDLKRNGRCLYLDEQTPDGSPLFEAVVPFLHWQGVGGQAVFVSHYPATVDHKAERLLNYHGHLHREVLPATQRTHFVNVGWDVTQGLLCL